MTEWEPATEAEAAMRDALRANDQESYFRILARIDLLLPVSAQALAGRAPMGWGTWTTGGRTHVLAFTSSAALHACLAESAGSTRRSPYHELATNWPNLEWWLAVNPGLPIEGYLPAWFVSQLAQGDVRMPGRPVATRSRLERAEQLARARATAAVPRRPGQTAEPPFGSLPAAPAADQSRQFFAAEPAPDDRPAGQRSPAPWRSPVAPPEAPTAPLVEPPLANWYAAAGASATQPIAPPRQSAGLFEPSRPVEPSRPIESAGLFEPSGSVIDVPDTEQSTAWLEQPGASLFEPSANLKEGSPLAAPQRTAGGSRIEDDADATVQANTVPASPDPPVAVPDDPTVSSGPPTVPADFTPANDVEQSLLEAAGDGSTDTFLSTLLLAKVLLPISATSAAGTRPGQEGFTWRTERLDGETFVVVFTSPERLADHLPEPVETASVKFVQLIRQWPDEAWSFAVNPGTPVGAKLPGGQIVALASWAAEVGLGDEAEVGDPLPVPVVEEETSRPRYAPTRDDPDRPIMMQKTIAPSQVAYYLDRGYDRVSGFVHRASELAHLRTPAKLYGALGLNYPGSPFSRDASEIYVLRWPAHRPGLYRIPYGGQSEAAMRAMEGWVIERPPFRGNGFAPGETSDVVAEFKVDSVRLPHGAQLCRIGAGGTEEVVAILDSDIPAWSRVGEE